MVSRGFQTFMKESGQVGEAFGQLTEALAKENTLPAKYRHLCYLSALAAAGVTGGIAFHVQLAKREGATRDEVKSAVLSGLPVSGLRLLDCLDIALESYDN